MNVGGIDRNQILAMMEQLKAAAQRPAGVAAPTAEATGALAPGASAKVDFSDALKSSLQKVSDSQLQADELGKAFTLGDDRVNLSDVMISMQKASINFQATVQVRNKLVAAYHEIMNMQV